jgi:hypothetical protein
LIYPATVGEGKRSTGRRRKRVDLSGATISSPRDVPLLDDFAGYIEFNLDILDGRISAWWTMWDANLPIFARALYWLDFRLFGARFIFLITVPGPLSGRQQSH